MEKILKSGGCRTGCGKKNPIETRRRFRGGSQSEMVKRRRESRCQQQHRRNVAASSERSPLSANSAKGQTSALNLLTEGDHRRLQGINLRFSSFSQRSFLLRGGRRGFHALENT